MQLNYKAVSIMLTHFCSLQAFLTGCSAGGLATLIHCEDFRALLPEEVTVKCLADAGFFLDEYVSDNFECPLGLSHA